MTGYATYKKVPAAKAGVIVSGLMILVGERKCTSVFI